MKEQLLKWIERKRKGICRKLKPFEEEIDSYEDVEQVAHFKAMLLILDDVEKYVLRITNPRD